MARRAIGPATGKGKRVSIHDEEYLYDRTGNRYSLIRLRTLLLAALNIERIQAVRFRAS